jgi:ankyrin repeat protein
VPQGQIDNKLFAAVKNNNMTEIDRLIEGGARVNTKQADSWMTPLMCAIEFGTTTTCTKENKTASVENKDVVSCMEEMVKRLLSAQANVNDYNLNGETALIVATRKGSKQIPIHIFELLLQNDANKYWRDTLPQKSALDYAKQNKDRALINLLEKTDKDS